MNRFFLAFVFLATFFTSCDIKEEGIDANSKIYIESVYGNQVVTDYDTTFVAKDASGNDISANVTFYIDGVPQSAAVLRFHNAGAYQVKADISVDGTTKESDALTINVIEPRHSTKVLVEDFTGTWCVNCPRVAFHLEEAVNQDQHIIPVGVHFSHPPQVTDPFGFVNVSDLTTPYHISAFPTPFLNRNTVWDEQVGSLQQKIQKHQALGLAINSSVNAGNLTIDVKSRFDMNMSDADLFLVVYITENALFADQSNSTTYYGGQNPIPNFEHKHTLRVALNGVMGTQIPKNETQVNHTFVYHYSSVIPSEISDINNCEIVAFIGKNTPIDDVLNVQKAAIGTDKNFD